MRAAISLFALLFAAVALLVVGVWAFLLVSFLLSEISPPWLGAVLMTAWIVAGVAAFWLFVVLVVTGDCRVGVER